MTSSKTLDVSISAAKEERKNHDIHKSLHKFVELLLPSSLLSLETMKPSVAKINVEKSEIKKEKLEDDLNLNAQFVFVFSIFLFITFFEAPDRQVN